MKRALIVLLLLAVAGGLFAQISWSGHVQSGLEVVIPNEGDTTLHWYSRDAGIPFRFHLGGSYTTESGKAGLSAAIRNNNNAIGFDGATAWAQPLDILRIQFGTGGIGGFNSPGAFDTGNNAAGGNFSAVLTPVLDAASFSLGLGVVPADTTFAKSGYGVGLKFGLPGLLTAVANLGYTGSTEVTNVAAGVNVGALNAASGASGLTTLAVDVTAPNITNLAYIGIGPIIGFRVADVTAAGALTIDLRSKLFIPMGDSTDDLDYWVGLNLGVPFTPNVSAAISAGYEGKSTIPDVAENGTLSAADRGGLNQSISGGTDPAIIVRPSLTFNIGGGSLEAGLSLQALLASTTKIQNAIYAYYRVGF